MCVFVDCEVPVAAKKCTVYRSTFFGNLSYLYVHLYTVKFSVNLIPIYTFIIVVIINQSKETKVSSTAVKV
jgi:hypothetical protein